MLEKRQSLSRINARPKKNKKKEEFQIKIKIKTRFHKYTKKNKHNQDETQNNHNTKEFLTGKGLTITTQIIIMEATQRSIMSNNIGAIKEILFRREYSSSTDKNIRKSTRKRKTIVLEIKEHMMTL